MKLKPSKPFTLIIFYYLVGLIYFLLFRLIWLMVYPEFLVDTSVFDIFKTFLIGFRFDQIIVLYFLSPLLLILPWIPVSEKILKTIVASYFSLIYLILTLLMISDIRFFSYFDSHLNFLAFEYIGDGSTFFDLIVTEPYFYLAIVLVIIITLSMVIIKVRLIKKAEKIPNKYNWSNQIIYFILFLILFGVGLRGRLNLAPIDWGVAYHTDNNFVNQLGLNGIYTLGRNLTEIEHEPRLSFLSENKRFEFLPLDQCLKFVQGTIGGGNDRWHQPEKNLSRFISQPSRFDFKPNVIIVIMESWPARLTGTLGDDRGLTPNFDRLADDGMLFTNFYASGIRTNYGLAAILCSFPSLPGRSIMKRYDAKHPFTSFSEILNARGYFNCFVYGGDIVFDNMEGFLTRKKYDSFYSQDDFRKDDLFSKWGVPDHKLFERIVTMTDSLPRPFQLTALTLSNHEPFDLPDSTVQKHFDQSDSSKVFNSQIYADFAIGDFIDKISTAPLFDSSIFVFVSDHCKLKPSTIMADPYNFHIPCLIYSPALIDKNRVESFGTQVDLIPTLMSLLGGDYEFEGWGKNLLDTNLIDNGFAVFTIWNRMAYLDQQHLYIENVGNDFSYYLNSDSGFHKIEDSMTVNSEMLKAQNILRRTAQSAEQLSTVSFDFEN